MRRSRSLTAVSAAVILVLAPFVGAVISALLWNEVYLKGLTSPEAGASSVDIEQTQGAPTPAQAR